MRFYSHRIFRMKKAQKKRNKRTLMNLMVSWLIQSVHLQFICKSGVKLCWNQSTRQNDSFMIKIYRIKQAKARRVQIFL